MLVCHTTVITAYFNFSRKFADKSLQYSLQQLALEFIKLQNILLKSNKQANLQ